MKNSFVPVLLMGAVAVLSGGDIKVASAEDALDGECIKIDGWGKVKDVESVFMCVEGRQIDGNDKSVRYQPGEKIQGDLKRIVFKTDSVRESTVSGKSNAVVKLFNTGADTEVVFEPGSLVRENSDVRNNLGGKEQERQSAFRLDTQGGDSDNRMKSSAEINVSGEIKSDHNNAISIVRPNRFGDVSVTLNIKDGGVVSSGATRKHQPNYQYLEYEGYAITVFSGVSDVEINIEQGASVVGGIAAGATTSKRQINLIDGDMDVLDSEILGSWSLTKKGKGTWVLGKANDYTGATTIQEGTLKLGSKTGVPQSSATTIKAGGTLDLNSKSPLIDSITLDAGPGSGSVAEIMASTAKIKGGALTGTLTSNGGLISGVTGADLNVESGRTFLRDESSLGTVTVTGGQLWAADDQPETVADLTLNTSTGFTPKDPGDDGLTSDVQAGLVLGFDNAEASALKVTGTFTYTDGNVYLYKPKGEAGEDYEGTWNVMEFTEGDLSDAEYSALFANTYLMYESPDGHLELFRFTADGDADDANLLREVTLKKGSLQVEVGGLVYPDSQQDEDEDDIKDEVGGGLDLDGGIAGNVAEDFDLWTSNEVIDVVKHGLLPHNIDAAGSALASYNNLLAGTIFERTPMRQFTEVEPEIAVEPAVEPDEAPDAQPVQGLWSKDAQLDDADANAYLEEATSSMPLVVADAHTHAEHQSEHLIEINGKSYIENESLTAEYAERDGVRAWFRGFGGQSADSNGESDTLFNHYSISTGGGVVGADVALSDAFQIGAYANYGDVNLWHGSGTGDQGGHWEADGWGGGLTADYWTENFYVQGLFGASGFSGEQKRTIKYGDFFDETAEGDKSADSMLGALRIGAPFQSGNTYFEPQFTATWTGNDEKRFSESTDDDRLGLTYKSRQTNHLQTALGMKVAWPMKTGTTGLLTPSVKVAWLGDWDQGNEDQKIGLDFTSKGYAVSSNQDDVHGALLEVGVDYSVAKVEGTTVKAYLRGGAEVWGGERGTQWRASGGVTFQF